MSISGNSLPPLRLVLTTRCNGKCFFCHEEGQTASGDMEEKQIIEAVHDAKRLGIKAISLTGGEPTLRPDLGNIINRILCIYPDVELKLTTNGFNLTSHAQIIETPINTLNLSFTSFSEEIAHRYQNVDPLKALDALEEFPAAKKNLNVLVSTDNYLELDDIFQYCEKHSIDLDLMFELRKCRDQDRKLLLHVFRLLCIKGNAKVVMNSTPTIEVQCSSMRIRVKHPYLSRLIHRRICATCICQTECFERVCAVRVFANGDISPCINRHILTKSIEEAYQLFRFD